VTSPKTARKLGRQRLAKAEGLERKQIKNDERSAISAEKTLEFFGDTRLTY
jgi:hypothetical protein